MTRLSTAIELKRARVRIPGGELAMLRFGRQGAPPLLFAHANGFCASAYRQMFEAIGDRYDVHAVDLRGHGRTALPIDPAAHRSAEIFASDLSALLDALQAQRPNGAGWTLAGHSLGAVSVVLAAVRRNDIGGLRLIEPVAMPGFSYAAARLPGWRLVSKRLPLVKAAAGRRGTWPTRGDVLRSYGAKPFFSTWAKGVLEDYLEDGLRQSEGGVALSCSPQWEAATFGAQAHDFWKAVEAIKAPMRILAARHPGSTVSREAQRRFARLRLDVTMVEGYTHLLPFEDPNGAARFLYAP